MRLLGTIAAAALLVATLAGAARAELGADEKKWLRQCLDALTSKSAKVRDSGAAAIGKLGLDAVPALLPDVVRLKTDDDWSALAAALSQMGAEDAANAVDMARDKWPKVQEQRLAALVVRLHKAATAGPAPAKAPADLDAKVRELLAPFRTARVYTSGDPAVERVVALGRAAIPTLVAIVREGESDHGPGMLLEAATDALAALVDDSDVPVLAELLTEGRLVAARAFSRLRSPAALDALLDAVKRGSVSWELVETLDRFSGDERIGAALVAWLDAHATADSWKVAPVAEYLGEHRVPASVGPLLKAAAGPLDAQSGVKVGAALANLGRKEGIETLLKVMERAFGLMGSTDGYPRHEAGQTLNRIAGRAIYTGDFEPGAGAPGNADEAATQFRAWWTGVKDKIRFDTTRRAWVVD